MSHIKYIAKIDPILKKYRGKFEANRPKEKRLTTKEKEVGFDEVNRLGCHTFCNTDGLFMEEIYRCGGGKKYNKDDIDGFLGEWCFEAKSRHDTTNGKHLRTKAPSWIKFANDHGMKFVILVSTDIREQSRDIPLHEGHALSFVKDIPGYDPKRHRWISGSKVFEFVFPGAGKKIEKHLSNYRKSLKISGISDYRIDLIREAFLPLIESAEKTEEFKTIFSDNPKMLELFSIAASQEKQSQS